MNRRELMKLAGAALVSPVIIKTAGPSIAQSGTSQGTTTIASASIGRGMTDVRDADGIFSFVTGLDVIAGETFYGGEFGKLIDGRVFRCMWNDPDRFAIVAYRGHVGDSVLCFPLTDGCMWKK